MKETPNLSFYYNELGVEYGDLFEKNQLKTIFKSVKAILILNDEVRAFESFNDLILQGKNIWLFLDCFGGRASPGKWLSLSDSIKITVD